MKVKPQPDYKKCWRCGKLLKHLFTWRTILVKNRIRRVCARCFNPKKDNWMHNSTGNQL
jgi:hypothetical protein